ncbi:MAG TPA: GNAT family protein [Burkholderiaceae bacterium]
MNLATTPDLRLRPPRGEDAAVLLAFESRNRAWFEAAVNARPPSYYSEAGVHTAIEEAAAARAADRGYQFLVWEDDRLVGRVNLHDVRRGAHDCAELGYRVDRAENGRGIASRAVALCLVEAFGPIGLWRVEAVARVDNLGSLRVLERNGFARFGLSRRSFRLGGRWHDRVHFERHREPG